MGEHFPKFYGLEFITHRSAPHKDGFPHMCIGRDAFRSILLDKEMLRVFGSTKTVAETGLFYVAMWYHGAILRPSGSEIGTCEESELMEKSKSIAERMERQYTSGDEKYGAVNREITEFMKNLRGYVIDIK